LLSSVIFTAHAYCSGDEIDKIGVGGAYSTCGEVYRYMKGFGGRNQVKKTTWKTRRRRDDNIRMDLQEMRCEHMDCFDMDQDMDRWLALVNDVMDLRVQKKGEMSVLHRLG